MRVLIALVAAFWVGHVNAAEMQAGRLTVTGEGQIDSVPDMATITLGVMNEARTAGEAMSATSSAVSAILEGLVADGLEARDMQTRDLSLSPIWSNHSPNVNRPPSNVDRRPEIVGFQARNTVIIRARELDALGGILDRTIESGANTFQGLSFGLQDPGPALDAARSAAVAEALRRADLYAEAAGITLGAILEINEGGGSFNPAPMARMAMAEAMVIAQGEVTTGATVTIVFAIADGAAE